MQQDEHTPLVPGRTPANLLGIYITRHLYKMKTAVQTDFVGWQPLYNRCFL